MGIPVKIIEEEGNLVYSGFINDDEAGRLTKDKIFNLELSNGTIYIYIIGDK